ncbi:MAG: TRAP transporter small permease [Oscillospiraceae bacterium]|nr:TRAP transporter small permease [Oscillospiraceae bacterium]
MKKLGAEKSPIARAGQTILDIFEIYIPAVTFAAIFLIFMYQVICRYFFRNPVPWSYDITMTLYIYAIMFGACNVQRNDEHIVFSMIYDGCREDVKRAMRIIGGLLIIVVFALSLPTCFHYAITIITATIKKTSVVKIPYKILYAPIVFMMVDTLVRLLINLFKDIKAIFVKKEEA